jgi:hypothetical protein
LFAACEARRVPDDTAGDADESGEVGSDPGTGTSSTNAETSETAQSSELESTGAEPDPVAIQTACEDVCVLTIECQPEVIPKYYDSLEDCIAQCITGLEQNYADGCGPVQFMRVVCWTDFTCSEWLDFVETGYSSCGDEPGAQWCDD